MLKGLKGLLRRAEGEWLTEQARQVPPGQCIVEIGSFKGKSACFLAEGSRQGSGVPVVCIDPWEDGTQRHKAEKFARPINRERFDQQTEPYRDLVRPIRAKGHEAGRWWDGGSVGLLWIDGDHSFEGCLADFIVWSRFVPVGGVVAFHDYDAEYEASSLGAHADVIRVCDEHVTRPEWEPLGVTERIWAACRV